MTNAPSSRKRERLSARSACNERRVERGQQKREAKQGSRRKLLTGRQRASQRIQIVSRVACLCEERYLFPGIRARNSGQAERPVLLQVLQILAQAAERKRQRQSRATTKRDAKGHWSRGHTQRHGGKEGDNDGEEWRDGRSIVSFPSVTVSPASAHGQSDRLLSQLPIGVMEWPLHRSIM